MVNMEVASSVNDHGQAACAIIVPYYTAIDNRSSWNTWATARLKY